MMGKSTAPVSILRAKKRPVRLLWFNPSRQPSTTQQLAHSPSAGREGESERGKLENSLAEIKQEHKQSEIRNSFTPATSRQVFSRFKESNV